MFSLESDNSLVGPPITHVPRDDPSSAELGIRPRVREVVDSLGNDRSFAPVLGGSCWLGGTTLVVSSIYLLHGIQPWNLEWKSPINLGSLG